MIKCECEPMKYQTVKLALGKITNIKKLFHAEKFKLEKIPQSCDMKKIKISKYLLLSELGLCKYKQYNWDRFDRFVLTGQDACHKLF
jgi:hypothetical protein